MKFNQKETHMKKKIKKLYVFAYFFTFSSDGAKT